MNTSKQAQLFETKKVTIEAMQWTGENLKEIIAFTGLNDSAKKWTWEEFETVVKNEGLKIFTLEGTMLANVGDYIIKGLKGEFYPCKPDIFIQKYRPYPFSKGVVDAEMRDKYSTPADLDGAAEAYAKANYDEYNLSVISKLKEKVIADFKAGYQFALASGNKVNIERLLPESDDINQFALHHSNNYSVVGAPNHTFLMNVVPVILKEYNKEIKQRLQSLPAAKDGGEVDLLDWALKEGITFQGNYLQEKTATEIKKLYEQRKK